MGTQTTFTPPFWLKNSHIQTCYSQIKPFHAKLPETHEALELPDGDFLELMHYGEPQKQYVILLHGLEGSANAPYIQALLPHLIKAHFQVVVMQYRSCGHRINRLAEFYNAGEIKDLEFVIKILQERNPKQTLNLIGFSLGGSVLLNYLGKKQTDTHKAIAVSVPYDLSLCVQEMTQLYDRYFLKSIKEKLHKKHRKNIVLPISPTQIKNLKKLTDFDHQVIAPIYGFKDAEDYYQQSSCLPYLKSITNPTLLISAKDDPFIPAHTLPSPESLSNTIEHQWTDHGGHSGFIQGGAPWRAKHWLPKRIVGFLTN